MCQLTPAESRKYADYTTRIGADGTFTSFVEEYPEGWAKFYYRIYRVPSRKEFVLRMAADANTRERTHAEKVLAQMPSGAWAKFDPNSWLKHRAQEGYWYWKLIGGDNLDDPFVQLELEMMIDLSAGVTR